MKQLKSGLDQFETLEQPDILKSDNDGDSGSKRQEIRRKVYNELYRRQKKVQIKCMFRTDVDPMPDIQVRK